MSSINPTIKPTISVIRTYLNKDGYVVMTSDRFTKYLHRVLAEVKFGAIPAGYHVHHIDGNKTNNSASNLEIVSPKTHCQRHREASSWRVKGVWR